MIRVKAASFSTALRKAINSMEEDKKIDKKTQRALVVGIKVIKRNVGKHEEIPKFAKDQQ